MGCGVGGVGFRRGHEGTYPASPFVFLMGSDFVIQVLKYCNKLGVSGDVFYNAFDHVFEATTHVLFQCTLFSLVITLELPDNAGEPEVEHGKAPRTLSQMV